LLERLSNRFHERTPALIVEELGLCQGDSRVDVAVIDGNLLGYEIKSDKDTLIRLPRQHQYFRRIFDYMTLVTTSSHLERATQCIPDWWGILIVSCHGDKLKIRQHRRPKRNRSPDALAICQLLWRDEALDALQARSMDHGIRTKPRAVLWDRLASNLPLPTVRSLILHYFQRRTRWRSR